MQKKDEGRRRSRKPGDTQSQPNGDCNKMRKYVTRLWKLISGRTKHDNKTKQGQKDTTINGGNERMGKKKCYVVAEGK